MEEEAGDVVLVASTSEQSIGVWDLETSTFLTTYKDNLSGPNALATVGRDYFVAAQKGKGQAIHTWAWHKDQIHFRSFTPEPVASLTCSLDGNFCAAGCVKGNAYIWETSTGSLLRSFSAHYKCVTALAFSDDAALLVTCGEDAVVSVWLMMSLLDASADHNPTHVNPQPRHSWSQHTLPVTGLYIGPGISNPMVATTSLDRTCKIRGLISGQLVRSFALPVALTCLVPDPWLQSMFMGAHDGRIFEVPIRTDQAGSSETAGSIPAEASIHTLVGHSQAVHSLATSTSGCHLVSGSEDSTVRVWDLKTCQVLRVIQAKGPVSSVLVITKPFFMAAGRGSQSGYYFKRNASAHNNTVILIKTLLYLLSHASMSTLQARLYTQWKKGPERPQPIAILKKYADNLADSQPRLILDGLQPYRGIVSETALLEPDEDQIFNLEETEQDASSMSAEYKSVAAERDQLKAQLESATKTIADLRDMNAKMHAFVVESSLPETDS